MEYKEITIVFGVMLIVLEEVTMELKVIETQSGEVPIKSEAHLMELKEAIIESLVTTMVLEDMVKVFGVIRIEFKEMETGLNEILILHSQNDTKYNSYFY